MGGHPLRVRIHKHERRPAIAPISRASSLFRILGFADGLIEQKDASELYNTWLAEHLKEPLTAGERKSARPPE